MSTGARAPEEDVRAGGGDVEVLRVGQVDEKREDDQHVAPDEDPLEDLGRRVVAEEARERIRERRPGGRPLVEAERDLAGVPEEERSDDPGDEGEDEVGLAEMAPFEAPWLLRLADPERGRDADQHEGAEDVDEEREPALGLEPGERRAAKIRLAVDDVDQRDQDRRKEDDEAPEDERVHEPGAEPLEELPLAEDDRRLVLDALGDVVEAPERSAHADEADEQQSSPYEQRDRHGRDRRQGERGEPGRYPPLAFLSSAEIAGTTSCRSPMTA